MNLNNPTTTKETPKKPKENKTWEAAGRLKGTIIIYDPTLLQ